MGRSLKRFVPSERSEATDASQIRLRVVFIGRCPSVDDVARGKGAVLGFKVFVVGLQDAPSRAIAHRHRGELHERLVRLLHPHPLPTRGRVANVERVVVAETAGESFHERVVSCE